MRDLNDLYYFVKVIDHGGFAAAGRALGIPKSRLSRRVAQLETDLGVRLLQRSTRRFAITDLGASVYRHSQSALAKAQAAYEVVDLINGEPRGSIRVSAPATVAQQYIPRILPTFLARYPDVRVQLVVSDSRIDLIDEGIDVALYVRPPMDSDGSLVMRGFCQVQERLVASPEYLERTGRPSHPVELADHVTLCAKRAEAGPHWVLYDRDGVRHIIELRPRVTGLDSPTLMTLALKGVGITVLPEYLCADDVRGGALEIVLPQWRLPKRTFHALFPSRRGLLPAVRVFIDFLAETAPGLLELEPLVPADSAQLAADCPFASAA